MLQEPLTSAIVRDAAIHRFEFTFEAMWKFLQAQMRWEGRSCASPRGCLTEAVQRGWISANEEEVFLRMLHYRNLTVHTYNEDLAQAVYDFIREQAWPALERLRQRGVEDGLDDPTESHNPPPSS